MLLVIYSFSYLHFDMENCFWFPAFEVGQVSDLGKQGYRQMLHTLFSMLLVSPIFFKSTLRQTISSKSLKNLKFTS